MFLRKKKFLKIKNLYTFFKKNQSNIIVFVHKNNLNIIQQNLIHYYCLQNTINYLDININLAKKISSNKNFLNILAGPTTLYSFNSVYTFLNFFNNNKYISKKLLPLTIFWYNNFFCYQFFFDFLSLNLNKYQKDKPINISLFVLEKNMQIMNIINSFLLNINQILLFGIFNLISIFLNKQNFYKNTN